MPLVVSFVVVIVCTAALFGYLGYVAGKNAAYRRAKREVEQEFMIRRDAKGRFQSGAVKS